MTWSKDEIEDARQSQLAPILSDRGYEIRSMRGGACLVAEMQDLVVHNSRWFWKSANLKGNAIDFFMIVEGRTFAEAMEILKPD